jgi:hypothetical protein
VPVSEAAGEHVCRGAAAGDDREHEVRGRGCDMRWEAEDAYEQGDVDDSAADPEEARDEADDAAVGDPAAKRHRVEKRSAVTVGEDTFDESSACRRGSAGFSEQEPGGEGAEDCGHQDVEERAGDRADGERAKNRAGKRGRCEGETASVVDPSLMGVGSRAGGGVEEDGCETDRGQGGRFLVRVEHEQDRRKDEATTGTDDRPKRADREANRREQECDCRREGQRAGDQKPGRYQSPVSANWSPTYERTTSVQASASASVRSAAKR